MIINKDHLQHFFVRYNHKYLRRIMRLVELGLVKKFFCFFLNFSIENP